MPNTACRTLDCTPVRTVGLADSADTTLGWRGSARLTCAAALAAALCAGVPARASDGQAAPAAAVKPVAKAPAAAPVATTDPMDTLREKLAAKLGAAKAPESVSPFVVRVVSKSGNAANGAAAAARDLAALAAALWPPALAVV